jgi:hypothetical protein
MGLRNWLQQKTADRLGVEVINGQAKVIRASARTIEDYTREVARLLIEHFPETRFEVLEHYRDLYERPINQKYRALALTHWDWPRPKTP